MNPRELLLLIEPPLAGARDKLMPLLAAPLSGASEAHAASDPTARIASGLLAGVLAGRVVSRLGR